MGGHQIQIKGVGMIPVDGLIPEARFHHIQWRVVGVHVQQQRADARSRSRTGRALANAAHQLIGDGGFPTARPAYDSHQPWMILHRAP